MVQNNFEDYLEHSEKISDKVTFSITKAHTREESERRALGIVEFFLESSVSRSIFLKSIAYLNKFYYDDVVEERALLQLCGYPLCSQKITESKKQYKICNKTKQLYDLKKYGYFCSIFCFDASYHIRSQIRNSSLWLRDNEGKPTFRLLEKEENIADNNTKTRLCEKNEEFNLIGILTTLSIDDAGASNFSDPTIAYNRVGSSVKLNHKTKLSTEMKNDIKNIQNFNEKTEKSNNCGYLAAKKQYEKCKNVHTKKVSQEDMKELNDKISDLRLADSTKDNKNSGKSSRKTEYNQNQKNLSIKAQKDLKYVIDKIKNKNKKIEIKMIDPLPFKPKNLNMTD